MKLPNDITRCHNGTCPFREDCLRWILRGDYGAVSAYLIPNGTWCQHMLQKPESPKEPNLNLIQK